MKLTEAIEILQDIKHTCHLDKRKDEELATGLGIEAMKVVQRSRKPHNTTYTGLLPGEDKE